VLAKADPAKLDKITRRMTSGRQLMINIQSKKDKSETNALRAFLNSDSLFLSAVRPITASRIKLDRIPQRAAGRKEKLKVVATKRGVKRNLDFGTG